MTTYLYWEPIFFPTRTWIWYNQTWSWKRCSGWRAYSCRNWIRTQPGIY